MTINTYSELQAYITKILTENISTVSGNNEGLDSEGSPHGAFWNLLTYEQFVYGNVPHVLDPDTGQALPILVRGEPSKSNLVLALKGAAGTVFDPASGAFGQMPADGPPFFTAEQIKPIEEWIAAGCPE